MPPIPCHSYLRDADELGVPAQSLENLLQRVNEDVEREHIRAEQEKDTWRAVGTRSCRRRCR